MMHGIDISAYQPDLDFGRVEGDFVFVKATGGPGYTNPHFRRQITEAQAAGYKVGAYHFARDGWTGTTAEEEADHFLATIKGLNVLPVLDWEADNVHDTGWALRWLELVTEALGVKPLIYMNRSVATSYDWSKVIAGGYRLWLALYGDDKQVVGYQPLAAPSLSQWGSPAIWQYTQHGRLPGYPGDLDLNVAYEDVWGGKELLIPDVPEVFKP